MKGSVVVQAKEALRSRQSLALLALPVIVMGPVESFVLASNRGHQQTAEAEDPARIQLQATAAEQQAKAEPPMAWMVELGAARAKKAAAAAKTEAAQVQKVSTLGEAKAHAKAAETFAATISICVFFLSVISLCLFLSA